MIDITKNYINLGEYLQRSTPANLAEGVVVWNDYLIIGQGLNQLPRTGPLPSEPIEPEEEQTKTAAESV